jgi:hypothetical protein
MTNFTKEEILAQLDLAADKKHYNYPLLQFCGYIWTGRSKLKVFLSDTQWLIVFENLNWDEGAWRFKKDIYAIGSDKIDGFHSEAEIIEACPSVPFWNDDTMSNDILLDYLDFEVMIKGERKHFTFTEQDYANLGIDFAEKRTIKQAKILRILAFTFPEMLFDSDTELLAKVRNNESGYQLFLELDEWEQPEDMFVMPSEGSTSYQSIAEAIAQRDASLYHCPKELCNSHWTIEADEEM